MEFTHLHVHTEYSLLDGSNKIKEYVARVKELGMDSAAITDHGVMYGVIDFYRAARAEGINPILGCEVYVAPGSRFDREAGNGEDRYYHLVLLAENNQGYANLMKIVSKGFTEGFYYKPRVDLEVLREYHEGIIALSACLAGEVARYLQRGMYEDAKAVIDKTLTATADVEEKPSVMVLEPLGEDITNYGAKSLGGDMVTQLGATLANPDASTAGKEDIIAANPDVIFVVYMPYAGDDPETVKESQLAVIKDDEALQSLDAVKNGRVYPIMLSEMYASATRTQDGIETFAKGLYPDVNFD